MACPSAFDALRIATENLPDTIHQRSVKSSIWLNAIPRTEFPMNAGVNQTTFVVGNSEPTSNDESWSEITLSNNAVSNMCAASYTDVDVGYDEYTYTPRRFGLAGPIICRETLGFAHKPAQFVKAYIQKLGHRAKRSWEFQLRNAYTAIADKAICRPNELHLTQGATVFPQLPASSQLTWDYLDEAALHLTQEGATSPDDDLITWGPDGPQFLLNIGIQAKNKLFTNVDVKRADTRAVEQGFGDKSLLFRAIGATDTHKNFRMVPELYPERYTFTPGVGYVKVATWEMIPGSQGTSASLTAAWKAAPYEKCEIINPAVMNAAMVKPDSAGLDWNPINYSLDWSWKTGPEISTTYCFDPKHNYGRHFADAIYAPEAVFPAYGMTIIFKRCLNDITGAACTYA